MDVKPCDPALFPFMREIGVEAERFWARAAELTPRNAIALGGAAEDKAHKGAAIDAFLRVLRAGVSPMDAVPLAQVAIQHAITQHNARRDDIHWQRSVDSLASFIANLGRRAVQSLPSTRGVGV